MNGLYTRAIQLLSFCVVLGLASLASAATRTVCFQVQVRDDRNGCPTPGTTGAKRACDPGGGYSDFVGAVVQLWDKDSTAADDDFIGEWVVSGAGAQCASFEWEGNRSGHGDTTEVNPDVFLKLKKESRASNGTGALAGVKDGSGTIASAKVTWRDSGADFNISNCATGTPCTFGDIHVPTHSTTSDMAIHFMMLDSMQRGLEMYSSELDSGTVYGWYPTVNTPAGESCSTGRTWAQHEFCLPSGLGNDGDRTLHEFGHMTQMQMFEQDSLIDVISGSAWSMAVDSFETESAATTEGFAAYVGAVAWYDPQNTSVVPFYSSVDIEAPALAQATCSDNITLPRQVAKMFWDLDDLNNEAGTRAGADDDVTSISTTWILQQWDEFDDGTGNRQDREGDANGVNVRDYNSYAGSSTETVLEHNCLVDQDNN